MAEEKSRLRRFSGISAAVFASVAAANSGVYAQSASAPADLDEVVVTGTHLKLSGATSPTPLTTVSTDDLLQTTPTNLPDALNKLPQFIGSTEPHRPGGGGSNIASNTLNLRGFGVQRTLVLLDGHRIPPAAADGTVDVDTLPEMLVSRVDVVTGGASAVYGSDAVSGVVNYILDKRFNGVKFDTNAGESTYGDGRGYKAGIAGGTDLLGGDAHIEGSFVHNTRNAVSDVDRPYGSLYAVTTGSGTAANPYKTSYNARRADSTFGGLVDSCTKPCSALGQAFGPNGLVAFNPGTTTGTANVNSGGDGAYAPYSTALSSLQTDQAFGRFSYDIDDNTEFYVQGQYGQAYSFGYHFPNKLSPGSTQASNFYKNNPFLTPAEQTALGNNGQSNSSNLFGIGEYITSQGADGTNATKNTNVNKEVTTGVSGQIFGRFDWETYYTHGVNNATVELLNNPNQQKEFAAEDAVLGANGQIQCYAATQAATASAYANCVPLNPFGSKSITKQALDYYTQTTSYYMTNTIDDIGGTLGGTVFDEWAGPVKVALSAEARWNGYNVTNNVGNPTATVDCTGLRLCNATQPLYAQNVVPALSVSDNVHEFAIEAQVPLLADLPLIKSLNTNLAARYTDYSVSGGVWTHKIGFEYTVINDIRLRGTTSLDIRAPTLNDLYQPAAISTSNYSDPHTGRSNQVYTSSQGNKNLVPEQANTYTFGGVVEPRFIPNLTMSLDYYHVDMNNEIASISGTTPAIANLCESSNGTSPYCALYVRPLAFSNRTAANFPTLLYSEVLNAAKAQLAGVDFEASYRFKMADIVEGWQGNWASRFYANYQPVNQQQLYPGAPITKGALEQSGLTPVSKTHATFTLSYTTDDWTGTLQDNWTSGYEQSTQIGQDYAQSYVPQFNTVDITIDRHIHSPGLELTAYFTVQNIANMKAPLVPQSSSIGLSYPVTYGEDIMGRYLTLGMRGQF